MRNTFFSLFENLIGLMNLTISVIISLAVLGFMWGVVKILFNPTNEIAKKEGRSFMLYGVLTLFVMTSVWGLVNILNGTITVGNDGGWGDVNNYSEDINSPEEQFEPIRDVQDVFDDNLEQRAI